MTRALLPALTAMIVSGCGSAQQTSLFVSSSDPVVAATQHPGPVARTREGLYDGSTGNWPPGDYQPFNSDSIFNMPMASSPGVLKSNIEVYANSAKVMANIFAEGGIAGQDIGIGADANAIEYSYPFYYASNDAPLYKVHCLDYTSNGRFPCPLEGKTLHIPKGALPENSGPIETNAGGESGPVGDAHLAVLDIVDDKEYDFLGAPIPTGTSSTVATPFDVGYAGSGTIFNNGSLTAYGYGAVGMSPEPFQATHGDVALTLGILRPADLLSSDGVIPHALQVSVPCAGVSTSSPGVYPFSYVASDTPCASSMTNAPEYGMHLFLAATAQQLDALGLTGYQKSIWTAMATYGAIITDVNGNSSIQFQTEDPLTYTTQGGANLWAKLAAKYGIPITQSGNEGNKYYFAFSPNLAAANFIQSHLEIIEYASICDASSAAPTCETSTL